MQQTYKEMIDERIQYSRTAGSEIVDPIFTKLSINYDSMKGTFFSLYIVNKDNKYVSYLSQWQLSEMPGCSHVAISLDVSVKEVYRSRGIGSILNRFRIHLAHLMGFKYMICSVLTDNEHQLNILEKNNWRRFDEFYAIKYQNSGDGTYGHSKEIALYGTNVYEDGMIAGYDLSVLGR